MNLRTIRSVIDDFEKDYIAYCAKGKMKGTFIATCLERSKLMIVYPDGASSYNFSIKMTDKPKEDAKQWVFHHEVEDDVLKLGIIEGMAKVFIEAAKKTKLEESK